MKMKTILKTLALSLALIPSLVFSATVVGWSTPTITTGWVLPNLVNGASQTIFANNGLFSTASSTFSSNLFLTSLSQGILFTGTNGKVNTVATSTLSGSGVISVTAGAYVPGGTPIVVSCATCGTGSVTSITLGDDLFGTSPLTTTGTIYGSVGTGTTPVIGQLGFWQSVGDATHGAHLGTVGTSSASCSGGTNCSSFTVVGGVSPVISSFSFPFTIASHWQQTTAGTTTALWLQGSPFSLFASSTSVFNNASTTLFTLSGASDGCAQFSNSGLLSSTGSACGSSSGLTSYDAFTHPFAGFSATTSTMLSKNASTTNFSAYGYAEFPFFNATSTTATSTVTNALQIGGTAGDNALKITASRVYPASQSVGGMVNLTNTLNSGPAMNIYSAFGAGATAPQFKVRNDNTAYDQEMVTFQSLSDTRTTLGITGSSTAQAVLKISHQGIGTDGNVALVSLDATGSGTAAQGVFMTSTGGGTTGKLLQLKNNLAIFGGANAEVNQFDVTGDGKVGIASSTPWAFLSINPTSHSWDANAPWFAIGSTTGGTRFVIAANGTTTSTNGFDITKGCFSINGVCLSSGAGSGTVTSVVAGAGFQNQGLNITSSGTLVGAFATSATPTLGGLPYFTGVGDATNPAKLGTVATSSLAVGASLLTSGTLGAQVGGTASSLSINTANTNTWTVLQNFNYSSSTVYSSFVTASSTNLFAGNVTLSTTTAGCLANSATGVVYNTGSPCGTSSGLNSYDAWTHPAAGQSATTSLMLFNGNASTTQLSANIGFFNFFKATSTSATSTIANALQITAGQPTGSASENTTDGTLNIQNTTSPNLGLQVYTNAGAETDSPLVLFRSDNTAFDDGVLWLLQDGTSGGAYNIKNQGPAPQIEWVETDQSTPAGKFEDGVNGDIRYIASRNSADSSFENAFEFDRFANLGGFRALGTGLSYFTGMLNISTTTGGYYPLIIASSTVPQLSLSAGTGISQWTFRNAGGNLYIATTTVAGTATSTNSAFSLNTNGIPTIPSLGGTIGCAQFSATGVLSNTGSACGTSGGSSGGTWSTTTSTVAGQLINYSNNTTDIVTIGSNATTSAEFYFDPNLPFFNLGGTMYSNTDWGSGTQLPSSLRTSGDKAIMFWNPWHGAFWAGEWDTGTLSETDVGDTSTAFGYNNKATGYASFATGRGNTVGSQWSAAFGRNNTISGSSGEANLVNGVSNTISNSATYSFATGNSNTIDAVTDATAIGNTNVIHAGASDSFIAGNNNTLGVNAADNIAFGDGNTIYGDSSFSLGNSNIINDGSNSAFIFGYFASTTATGAITMGYGFSNTNRLVNTADKTLYIGFNSNIPTFVVTPAASANAIGKVGIGTSTPAWGLQIASTTSSGVGFLGLSDTRAPANLKHWTLSSQGGNLYIATSTDQYATSSVSALTIDKNGKVKANCFTNDGTTCITSGAGSTPGGADTNVQFNDGGTFGGIFGMSYDKNTGEFKIGDGIATTTLSNGEDGIQQNGSDLGITTNGSYSINFNAGNSNYTFNNASDIKGILDLSALTSSDKTFTFPDQSGTICIVGVACDGSGSGGDPFTHSSIFLPNSATTSKIAIGTTTPYYSLTVASTTGAQFALSDGTSGIAQWTFRNAGANLYIGTSTVAGTATTTNISALSLLNNGNVGVATTTPGSLFSIGMAGGINLGTATSTFGSNSNGINITNGCFAIGGVCVGSGSAGGLTSYDAFTHPLAGQSATTSLMLFNGQASSTQLSAYTAFFGGSGTTTITNTGLLGVNDSTPDFRLEAVGSSGSGYFGLTKTTDGDILSVINNGNIGIGSTTPWGLLSIASTTPDYLTPLFSISTSTDTFGNLFNVSATSTTLKNISTAVFAANPDLGVRVGVGTLNYFGYGGLLDQFVVKGRVNTEGWNMSFCDIPSGQGTSATASNICSSFSVGAAVTAASALLNGNAGQGGYAWATANLAIGTAANAGVTFVHGETSGGAGWLTPATSTPVMEVNARITPVASSSAQFYIGFDNNVKTGTMVITYPTDGCFFNASSTARNGNWWAVNAKASAYTFADTGVASSTNVTATGGWRKFRIEADNDSCEYYIQATDSSKLSKVASLTTNVPVVGLKANVWIAKTISVGAAQGLQFNHFRVWWRDFLADL